MNLEIASRLVALRKDNNLSQEALAEKLGISRQAVSKWERAEASPDTDNLIALAKLYHISLDELLMIHEDVTDGQQDMETNTQSISKETAQTEESQKTENSEQKESDDEENVHVGFDGIHVKDKNGEVHVSWSGIHVLDKENENEVHIDKNGIRLKGDDAENHLFTRGKDAGFPLGMAAIVIYILIGSFFDLWHPGWLIFFLVPIISSLMHAMRTHNANLFAYPILVVLIFLYVGLVHYVWHPTWVVFLTVPLYYSMVEYFRQRRKERIREDENEIIVEDTEE